MFITILLFIVILGLLIFVHEFGHFYMARKMGIGVDEFGFGYPPRIFGIQKSKKDNRWHVIGRFSKKKNPEENGDVVYSINWIPVGGFVKIKGEQGDTRKDKDSFSSKKIWQRVVVLSAGVVMNLILAFIIISIGFGLGLPSMVGDSLPQSAEVKDRRLQIVEVIEDSPSKAAGLELGDTIKSIDGTSVVTISDFQDYIQPRADSEVALRIGRGDEVLDKIIIPKDYEESGEAKIGAWLAETGIVSYPWYVAIWMGAKTTISITWQIIVAFYDIIKNFVITQQVSADIAGPVGIAVMTGQVVKLGFIYILQFTAILSINLVILNFMPFPALDGGRVFLLIIEKIRGKPLNQRIEAAIHNIGFLLLLLLLVIITFRDVFRIF